MDVRRSLTRLQFHLLLFMVYAQNHPKAPRPIAGPRRHAKESNKKNPRSKNCRQERTPRPPVLTQILCYCSSANLLVRVMAASKVVVVGSCMTDLVSYTPRLPKPGETLHGHRFSIGFGGKGANQCIAATRLGAATSMVAMVGEDSFGHNYLENFKANGVDTKHVGVTVEAATGVAPIAVDDAGENSIIIVAGANLKMKAEDIEHAEEVISNCSVVVCQGEITMEATLAALKLARKHNVKTVMNAAPANADLDLEILRNSDIFCVNESEAEVLTSVEVKCTADAECAAEKLLSRGCKSVIITLGGEGALYSADGQHKHVQAEKVTPLDTTGAGDAFVGALAYFLAYHPHLSMTEMMQRSCKVATVSVQAPGTQSSYPKRDDLPKDLFL